MEWAGYIERSKSRALVDLLANKTDFGVEVPNADDIRKLLDGAHAVEVESLAQTGDAKRTLTISTAVKSLQQQAPELASLVSVSSVLVSEIQGLLSGDESLIEYYYDGHGLYAFILTPDGVQGQILDGKGFLSPVRRRWRAKAKP